ncbi:MAG: hypothetical protein DSY42_08320 [Aquifex sp.]|nr:MAG: hypothetical protein DSY42_08320 [Aquifex sp.]
MKVKTAYITNIGKVRLKNEDAILVDKKIFKETSLNQVIYEELEISDVTAFAVADGLGGHACGEKASGIVLETLKGSKPKQVDDVKEIIFNAKRKLDEYINSGHEYCFGMGTALAGIYLSPRKVFVFNVGDCRVYRFSSEKLEILTRDHTFVFNLFLKGKISYDDLRVHIERNMLETAIMGGYSELPEVFFKEEIPNKGDIFLICSDGLWEPISFKEKVLCLKKGEILEKARCLYEIAYQEGKDNISFILLEIDQI